MSAAVIHGWGWGVVAVVWLWGVLLGGTIVTRSSYYQDGRKRAETAKAGMLDEIERLSKENASLRGYVTTVAAGVLRNDLLAIEKEFTDAQA